MKDLRGTWRQAIWGLIWPIGLLVVIRWALVEPFVVPSGSMIPTLQIHDHLFASKLSYGWHWPFSQKWLVQWDRPHRGEIVVFYYPENPKLHFVKRVIGVASDEISLRAGQLFINSTPIAQLEQASSEDGFQYYQEAGSYTIRYIDKAFADYGPITVPPGKFFVMGDNRDQSSDSRIWGFVPEENAVGRVLTIWLACEKTLPSADFLCDPSTLKLNRVFQNPK